MSSGFKVSLAVLAPFACATLILCAGVTNTFGTGTRLQTNVAGWLSDGAQRDTFWDASVVDVPGFSVYAVHCHGRMRLDVQAGATSPSHSNPCYAALGMYRGGGWESETYLVLPGRSMALYRESANNGPWSYGIGSVIQPVLTGQTKVCDQEYHAVQDGLFAYMAVNNVDTVPLTSGTNDMTFPIPLYAKNPAATNRYFVPNNHTRWSYAWDSTGRITEIIESPGGPSVPLGCVVEP